MPIGRPHASCLLQAEAYFENMGMTAWRVPGRWPDGGLSEGYGQGGLVDCLGDGQTEAYLRDTGMADLASAWAMVRRK